MRIVIDTNVIASAVFFGGRPAELVRLVLNKEQSAVATQEILEEYQETIDYLTEKYPERKRRFSALGLFATMEIIEAKSEINVCRDPDDNKFLSCAIDGKCCYVVSGDKDLLSLQECQGVQIVTVAQFLENVAAV